VKPRPVIPRVLAVRDIQEAVDFHFSEGAEPAAMRFVDAVERAFVHIGRFPSSGSLRYAQELGLVDLRCRRVVRFPHLVFYQDRGDHLDVWRVLHGQRDIPAWLGEPRS